MTGEESTDERYAQLRKTGTIIVAADHASAAVSGLRRKAKADGLRISAYRGTAKNLSPSQARQRPTHISLTADGTNIVAPDAHH